MAEDYGICMNLLLLFYLGMRSLRHENQGKGRGSLLIPTIGVANCYLTLMRGLWMSLAAGWLVQTARRNFMRFLRVTPVVAVLVWVFLKCVLPVVAKDVVEQRLRNEGTVNARIATYKSALAMFADYPILGVGFSSFAEVIETTSGRYERFHKGEPSVTLPHNVFMSLLAETGIVGILCFLFFVWRAIRSCFWLGHSQLVERREYAVFALSAIAAYLVDGLSLHPIMSIDFPNNYLFIFLGVLSGMVDAQQMKQPRPSYSG